MSDQQLREQFEQEFRHRFSSTYSASTIGLTEMLRYEDGEYWWSETRYMWHFFKAGVGVGGTVAEERNPLLAMVAKKEWALIPVVGGAWCVEDSVPNGGGDCDVDEIGRGNTPEEAIRAAIASLSTNPGGEGA